VLSAGRLSSDMVATEANLVGGSGTAANAARWPGKLKELREGAEQSGGRSARSSNQISGRESLQPPSSATKSGPLTTLKEHHGLIHALGNALRRAAARQLTCQTDVLESSETALCSLASWPETAYSCRYLVRDFSSSASPDMIPGLFFEHPDALLTRHANYPANP
jgi:hypothetical protein